MLRGRAAGQISVDALCDVSQACLGFLGHQRRGNPVSKRRCTLLTVNRPAGRLSTTYRFQAHGSRIIDSQNLTKSRNCIMRATPPRARRNVQQFLVDPVMNSGMINSGLDCPISDGEVR
jgi:hypothetical protein